MMLVRSGETTPVLTRGSVCCVYRDRPVLIVHGDKREAKARLVQQAQPFPHVRFCQVQTHHHCLTVCLEFILAYILITRICNVG